MVNDLILPVIQSFTPYPLLGLGKLKLNPADFGLKAVYTLDRFPIYYRIKTEMNSHLHSHLHVWAI